MTALAEFVHSLNLAESVALLAKPMAALAKPVAAPAKSVAAHLEPNKVPIFVNHFCFLVTYLWLKAAPLPYWSCMFLYSWVYVMT